VTLVLVVDDGGIRSGYQNISHICNGPDWSKHVISPQTAFFNGVSNGRLRAPSPIAPTRENSGYAECWGDGEAFRVASLVNAIGHRSRGTTPRSPPFDFNKPARTSEAVPSVHGIDYFKHQPIDRRPVDSE
jgi:hypothetical protein